MTLKELSLLWWTQRFGHCMGSVVLAFVWIKPSNIGDCFVPFLKWKHRKIARIWDSCWSSPSDWVDNRKECFSCRPLPHFTPGLENSHMPPMDDISSKSALQASDHLVRDRKFYFPLSLRGKWHLCFLIPHLHNAFLPLIFLSVVPSVFPKAVAFLSHSGSIKIHILFCEILT